MSPKLKLIVEEGYAQVICHSAPVKAFGNVNFVSIQDPQGNWPVIGNPSDKGKNDHRSQDKCKTPMSDNSEYRSYRLPETSRLRGESHEPYLVRNFSLIAVYEFFPKSHFIHKFTWGSDDCDRAKNTFNLSLGLFPLDVRVEYNARKNSDAHDIELVWL